MFLSKCTIACLTTLVCYFILKQNDAITSIYIPLGCCFVIAYVAGSIFISVFDASSNTILMCYLVDMDIAKQGGMSDPKHIPERLEKFLGIHKTDPEDDEYKNANSMN